MRKAHSSVESLGKGKKKVRAREMPRRRVGPNFRVWLSLVPSLLEHS